MDALNAFFPGSAHGQDADFVPPKASSENCDTSPGLDPRANGPGTAQGAGAVKNIRSGNPIPLSLQSWEKSWLVKIMESDFLDDWIIPN